MQGTRTDPLFQCSITELPCIILVSLRGRLMPAHRMTHDEYLKKVKEKHCRKIKVIGIYDGYSKRILHLCNLCKTIFSAKPHMLLKYHKNGCRNCSKPKKTHSNYLKQLKDTHSGKIKVLGTYIGANIKLAHQCVKCKSIWQATPGNILNVGSGCPECAKQFMGNGVIPKKIFLTKLNKTHNGKIKLISPYKKSTSRMLFVCKLGHTWKAYGTDVARSTGCPTCSMSSRTSYSHKKFILNGKEINIQGYEDKVLRSYLLQGKYTENEIFAETKNIPVIKYSINSTGRPRRYYPDFFTPKDNTIHEVKSLYTLGLYSNSVYKSKSSVVFNQIKEKALATMSEGFRFRLVVATSDGVIIPLPSRWLDMKRLELKSWIKENTSLFKLYKELLDSEQMISRLKGHAFC